MRVVESLRTALIWGLCSTLLGVGLAVEEILSHGYLALSFERSALLVARDSVISAVRTGLVAGLGWAVIVWIARRLVAVVPRFDDPGGTRPAAWRMAAGATAGLVALGVLLCLRGRIFPAALKYISIACDVVLVTATASLGSGPNSPLVLVYFLIIALATLRFSLPLIWCTTIGSIGPTSGNRTAPDPFSGSLRRTRQRIINEPSSNRETTSRETATR